MNEQETINALASNGLTITSVAVKNFLSTGNVTQAVRLNDTGLTLILGHNQDANGETTKNGAGKTTLLQALSYGLFGQSLTRIKVGNLVNNINQKNMFVVVEFSRDGVEYRIERGKKPDVLRFYRAGVDVTDVDNDAKGENRETQHDIDDVIGMSHTMFCHIAALNTYTDPFLKSAAGKQRELVEELFGVTQISQRAENLKRIISSTKGVVASEESYVSATEAANRRIGAAIEQAKSTRDQWDRTKKSRLDQLVSDLSVVENIDYDSELTKFDNVEKWRKNRAIVLSDLTNVKKTMDASAQRISRSTADLNRLNDVDLDAIFAKTKSRAESDIARWAADKTTIAQQVESAEAEIARLSDMLENADDQECRTCGQALKGTEHLSYVVKRINEDIASQKDKIKTFVAKLASLAKSISDTEVEMVSGAAAHEASKEENAARVKELLAEIQTLMVEEKTLTEQISTLSEELDKLGECPEATVFNSRDDIYAAKHARETLVGELARVAEETNPYADQVEQMETSVQVINMDVLNNAHDDLKHQEFLLKLLTSKDSFIRRKIVDQNLAYLNGRLRYYLSKLGLPHEVVFQSDLSVEIMLIGREMDFAQLSRGEGNRVNLAVSWSFRDVWESLNHRCNLMWIDEHLDSGLCAQGAEDALQILKSFARAGRNIFLISHREELVGRIDQIITVAKENGFTTISVN